MAKNLYVGNMSFDTTQDRLQELFEAYGEVTSASAAIAALDGKQVDGRTLTVNEARPRATRGDSRGGGRGGDRRRRPY
jgi:cold-inducible RNA-binding protein